VQVEGRSGSALLASTVWMFISWPSVALLRPGELAPVEGHYWPPPPSTVSAPENPLMTSLPLPPTRMSLKAAADDVEAFRLLMQVDGDRRCGGAGPDCRDIRELAVQGGVQVRRRCGEDKRVVAAAAIQGIAAGKAVEDVCRARCRL